MAGIFLCLHNYLWGVFFPVAHWTILKTKEVSSHLTEEYQYTEDPKLVLGGATELTHHTITG